MGCVESSFKVVDKEEAQANKRINTSLRGDALAYRMTRKILLLGAGESGKSTIFKQMKVIYQNSYTEDERKVFRSTIHANVLESARTLIEEASSRFPDPSGSAPPEYREDTEIVRGEQRFAELTPEMGQRIQRLWQSKHIQQTYVYRSSFQLMDNAAYFLSDLDRIAATNYIPTVQDILNSRVRTTGIQDMSFVTDGVTIRMFDVGGQRSERRKWIHCFDNCDAVLFVASLSEYDQVLWENNTQNRMVEALNVFCEICNSRFFVNTSMILFLNKRDLFEEKIARVDLSTCFPDYTGGTNSVEALDFLKTTFVSQNRHPEKKVYVHVTCATNTDNIEFVFKAVASIVFSRNMMSSGLM